MTRKDARDIAIIVAALLIGILGTIYWWNQKNDCEAHGGVLVKTANNGYGCVAGAGR